ncbi:uncharacterized protein TNCV_1807551 [Trichonephila clavipes]|nr:uncharacterized protein TNCV_1807551 [Trichonephila clavipes]
MEVTCVEQRAYFKIAVLRGRNVMECHSELVGALGNNALSYHTVALWVEKFQQGRVSTSDEQRSRPPVSVRKNWSTLSPGIYWSPKVQPISFRLLLQLDSTRHPPDISPCDFDLIPKNKEPIRDWWFAAREDIANAVRQQVTQFTHDAANAEADGIQCLPHRWQHAVTVAGDYIEGL